VALPGSEHIGSLFVAIAGCTIALAIPVLILVVIHNMAVLKSLEEKKQTGSGYGWFMQREGVQR
jgi:hypothetical protein